MTKRNFLFLILLCSINYNLNAQWNTLTTATSQFFYGEYFLNNDTGFVFGDGVVLKTTDGGLNWYSPSLAVLSQFTAMIFTDHGKGHLVSDGGIILTSTDSGVTWLLQSSPTNQLLYSIDFADSLNGIAVGDYATIIKTSDGGQNWTQVQNPYLFGDSLWYYELRTIQFINDSVAYAGGGPYNGSTGILIKTTDRGNTWNTVFESYDFPVFLQIEFINDTLGFASGSCHFNNPFCSRSKILKTTDGGISWTEIYFDLAIELRSLDVIGDKIYSVGFQNPVIVYSPDFGITWINQNPLNLVYPYQVFFTDSLTGYIVGDSGKVLKTINGGVGFSEFQPRKNYIKTYPNPSNISLTISFNLSFKQNSEIKIFNTLGEQVYFSKQEINAGKFEKEIRVQHFRNGIYFLQAAVGEEMLSKKIVVQH